MRHLTVLLPLLLLCSAACGQELRDPTRPPAPPAAAARPPSAGPVVPRVTAIFIADHRRVAIFNDVPVRAGDRVGAYQIEEIKVDGVLYSTAGHTGFAPFGARRSAWEPGMAKVRKI